ncbi:hypothetical protein [Candidatus Avelusimicrobium luingense]|jgi:hypothetical protein|uniref:hypothetical protein n=1 Tax=Candidatus Avelusimicrobium luingense TaxID=3416211 RepID=UPI003D0B4591
MSKYTIRTTSEKEEIMKYYRDHGWKAVDEKYHVSRGSFAHWLARIKNAKKTDAHPLARRYLIRPETVEFVKQVHKKNPGISLAGIVEQTTKKRQKISRTTVWHIITGR